MWKSSKLWVVVWCFSTGLPDAAKGSASLSSLYFFSLIINDGCFKLRNSAGKIQFSPGPCREGIKKSSVSKALVLL